MPHTHNHTHNSNSKNILLAFTLNAVFVVIEIVGGLFTNSISILSDALHDFGDCISLAITWMLNKKAEKGRDEKYSYGYKRFALLGSIFLGGILFLSSIYVVHEAITRLLNPETVKAQGMLWLAIVGITINGIAAYRLSKNKSISQRTVFLHMMEDVLGWMAILISSIIMIFWTIPILDSILSILITIWVLYHIWKNLKNTFEILLQSTPSDVNMKALTKDISNIEGVISYHDLHLWSLDGESHVITLHLVVNDLNDDSRKRINEALQKIASNYHIVSVTHQLELGGEYCNVLDT